MFSLVKLFLSNGIRRTSSMMLAARKYAQYIRGELCIHVLDTDNCQ
jgi:hypothetical protein